MDFNKLRQIEPFAVTFYENRDLPLNVKLALAARESAKSCFCEIDSTALLGGADAKRNAGKDCAAVPGMFTNFNNGVAVNQERFLELEEMYPEYADDFRIIYDYVKDFASAPYIDKRDPYHQRLIDAGIGWAGTWIGHANPDYDLLLHEGTLGLRKKIHIYKAMHPGKEDFYKGCEIMLDAIDILGERLYDQACAKAQTAETAKERTEYEKLAEAYAVIPKHPAYDMRSAVLLFWLVFSYDGVDSPGRLDQFFIDYWRKSDPEEAFCLLERLWFCFHDTRTWNLCISGSDENWNDQTNEISYAVLDLAEKHKFQTPNITLRLHRNSPEKLWRRAVEVISAGIGMPALYNDEVVCAALEKIGIPPRHSHLYCMNGCNQIDIMGKSHMGLEDGNVNFGKALELALHDGIDSLSGKQISIHTGDTEQFTCYEELLEAFYGQLDYITDVILTVSNSDQMVYAEHAPNPLRSCLIEGCLEKGRDYKDGGPLYGDGQILSFGMPETANSLAAVKKYIFEEKRFTMAELTDALRKNFVGYEKMYRVLSSGSKFGNDDPYVDSIMTEITDHWFARLKHTRTFRGGVYTGGCSTFVCAPDMGRKTGALPCGHLKADPGYSDSVNAVPGEDRSGPTAAVKSALCYDQTEVCSGFVFQLRFDRKMFATETGMEAFLQLAKTYFLNGGQQMSINVLSAEELKEAQLHPEKYGDLVVRVGGYSDYFVNLCKELQDNVIARSSHAC